MKHNARKGACALARLEPEKAPSDPSSLNQKLYEKMTASENVKTVM